VADITPYAVSDPTAQRYDLPEARRILAQAGYAGGLRMAIAVQDSDAGLAEALQAMWAKAGVALDVRRLEGGVYAATAFGDEAAKTREGLGGVIASWSSGVVPELQLRPLFARASRAPKGANLGFFDDGEIDRLLDMAEAASDGTARARLYAEVQRRIEDAAPDVLIFTRDDLVGLRQGVAGVRVTPDGAIDVTRATRS
jgi:glutathione transport system substrate-binding protein